MIALFKATRPSRSTAVSALAPRGTQCVGPCSNPFFHGLGHEYASERSWFNGSLLHRKRSFAHAIVNGNIAPKADMILGLTAPPLRPEALDKLSVACRAGSGG